MQRARKRSRDQGRWLSCSCACHSMRACHWSLALKKHTHVTPVLGWRVRGQDPWGLLTSSQTESVSPWARDRILNKQRVIEEYAQHWPLTSSYPCTYRHAHLYTQFNFKRKCIKYVNYQLTTEAIMTVPVTFMTKYLKRCVTQIVGRLDWNKTFPDIEWVCSCTAEDWSQGRAHTGKCSTTRYLLYPY